MNIRSAEAPETPAVRLWKSSFPWVSSFLAIAVALSLHDSHLSTDPAQWRIRRDISSYSLEASRAIWRGENPYDKVVLNGENYKYLPLNAVALLPLIWLPAPAVQGIWFSLCLLLLIAALRVHPRIAGLEHAGKWVWIIALLFGLRFFRDNLQKGQWNLPVYALAVLGFYLVCCSRRAWAGGALIGLAAALKFMPALFVPYFVLKRAWKAAATTALALLFWSLVAPSIVLGWPRHEALLKSFWEKAVNRKDSLLGGGEVVGHSVSATLYSFLTPSGKSDGRDQTERVNLWDLDRQTAAAAASAFCVLLVAPACLAFWRRGSGIRPGVGALLEAGTVFVILLMISPIVRKAQFLFLTTTVFSLMAALSHVSTPRWIKRAILGGLALSFFLLLSGSSLGFNEGIRRLHRLYGGFALLLADTYGVAVACLFAIPADAAGTSVWKE